MYGPQEMAATLGFTASRNLRVEEVRDPWAMFDGPEIDPLTAAALKLILVTGQRPGEVREARWDEFDLAAGWWTIPGERRKNGLPNRVPLNAIALDVLRALPRTGECVFPGRKAERPLSDGGLDKALRTARAKIMPDVERFTPHDLRRTARTGLAALGVPPFIADRIIGHAPKTVSDRHYDVHGYEMEKRAALEKWSAKLSATISDRTSDNVIALRGPSAG